MVVLSLFDGISTGRLVLQNLGIQVDSYYASEVDKIAIGTSKIHWKDIIQLGDVRKITKKQLKEIKPDLILAGSPCQGFSRQGSQLNFQDPRSKLFFVFLRILRYTQAHINPEVKFLLENVKMKNEWKDYITKLLRVNPIEINSRDYSAQSRPRLYWTNLQTSLPKPYNIDLKEVLNPSKTPTYKIGKIEFDKRYSEKERGIVFITPDERIRIKQATKQGYIEVSDFSGVNLSMPGSSTRRGRVVYHKSHCIDTGGEIGVYYHHKFRKFSCIELERLQTLPDNYTKYRIEDGVKLQNTRAQRIKMIGNGWTTSVIEILLGSLTKS